MAETDLDRLYNMVRVDLPNATDAGMKLALFDVVHEFFDLTNWWREDIDFATIVGTVDYALTPAAGGTVLRLLYVVSDSGTLIGATMPTLGTVTLANSPTGVQTYTATVAKTVKIPAEADGSPTLPSGLLPVWRVPLRHGLLGALLLQKNKPYSDAQLGTYHMKRFRDGAARARVATKHENTYGAQGWLYPQGWAVRGFRSGFRGEFG
jgi:hypothetical protein